MLHGYNKRTMMNMMPIMIRIKSCSKRTNMNMMNTKMRIRTQAKGEGGVLRIAGCTTTNFRKYA
jgi:hypothetical protein